MAHRGYPHQSVHDRVVEVAAENCRKSGNWTVHSNPGSEKNTRIGNLYPDIILTPLGDNNVQYIIEVETADSVTANEALNQWKAYSNLGGTFYLLIPQESRILAENICRQYGIRARFATFNINNLNQLTINYES